jgi:hypothetical protein
VEEDDEDEQDDDLSAFGEDENGIDAVETDESEESEPAEDWGAVPTWEEAISFLLHPETVEVEGGQAPRPTGAGGGRPPRSPSGDGPSGRPPSRNCGGRRPR